MVAIGMVGKQWMTMEKKFLGSQRMLIPTYYK
jgi:hypothetical protein